MADVTTHAPSPTIHRRHVGTNASRLLDDNARFAVIAVPPEIHDRATPPGRWPDKSRASILFDAQKLPARLAGIRD